MQLFFALVALCLCVRCLECGIQGQLRECGYGVEGCYDLDMRVSLDPKRPARAEPAGRDSYDPWPRYYEPWQLGRSEPLREPSPFEQRRRPRVPRFAGPRTTWQASNSP